MNASRRRNIVLGSILALVLILGIAPGALAAWPFSDVPVGHWAYNFIHRIALLNLTTGYPDGTYRPNNPITRAEMAVMLSQLTEATNNTNEPYIISVDNQNNGADYSGDGIQGYSADQDGLEGVSYGTGIADYGVRGSTNSTDSSEAGVYGDNTGAGAGVYGHGNAASTGYGVRAASYAAEAVYADSNATTYKYGGYFRGPGGLYAETEADSADALYGSCYSGGACWGLRGQSATSYGVYGQTDVASNNYGVYTPDNIWSNNYHSSGGLSMIARNAGDASLEVGDVVAISGIADPVGDSDLPVMAVRLADGSTTGVVGVVETAYKIEMVTRPKADFERVETEDPEGKGGSGDVVYVSREGEEVVPIHSAVDGPVQPGGLMLIKIQGIAQVKVSAAAGAVQPGDLLTVDGGGAAAKASLTAEGFAPAGTVIGKALEEVSGGDGLIWVFVDLR